mgnify:CR=1 FL=1
MHAPHLCLEPQLEADVADLGGIFHVEVRLHEGPRVVVKGLPLCIVEAELGELGIGVVLGDSLLERQHHHIADAVGRCMGEQQLEHPVHE